MPDQTTMGRIAERARMLYNQGKALVAPLDSEAQALKEKQQQINEVAPAPTEVPKMSYTPAPSDKIHPGMKYGDKPGEERLPSYQEGGDVPEDQTAKLDRGERVLNPEEAAAYRQAEIDVAPEEMKHEGMDVDMGGAKAIPNPKGIKPMMDTDKPEVKSEQLGGGAKMRIDNAPLGRTPMSTENTPVPKPGDIGMVDPKAQAAAAQMQEISTVGGTPRMNYTPMQVPPEPPKTPAEPSDQDIINQDKFDAMKKGDLVGMGMANINERLLNAGKPRPDQMPEKGFTPEEQTKQEEGALRDKMIHGATEQERFQAEKDLAEMKRRTPWGTPENHPGIMGKLGHIASRIGQAALMPTAPYLAPAIPGTQASLAAQEQRGETGVEGAQKKELTAADIAAKKAQPELAQAKLGLEEEKLDNARNALLRKQQLKVDDAGHQVPLTYDELSPQEQGAYDLNEAKANAQNNIAALKKAQADPNSPANKLILQKAKDDARKVDIAAGKLGIDADKYKADYLGVDHNGNPLEGGERTEEGKPVGVKVGKANEAGQTLQTKGVQARNVQDNLNAAIDLIDQNPSLFGKVAGRYTRTRDMIGTDDPAIDRLGNLIHNAALASTSVHGLRGEAAVEATEKELLNHFRNSPEATIAGMQDTINSMGTFTSAALHGAKKTIQAPTKKEAEAAKTKAPAGATNEVLKDGKVIGHVVNGKYVALPK